MNTNTNGPNNKNPHVQKENMQSIKKKNISPIEGQNIRPHKESNDGKRVVHVEQHKENREDIPKKKKVIHVESKDISAKRKNYDEEYRNVHPKDRPNPKSKYHDYDEEYYEPRYNERPPRRYEYYDDEIDHYDDYYDRPGKIRNNTKIVVIVAVAVAIIAIAVAVMCVLGKNNTNNNATQSIQAKTVNETETATTLSKGKECEASEDGYHHYKDSEVKIFYKAEYLYYCPECNSYLNQDEIKYHKTLDDDVDYQKTDHYYDEHIVSIGTRYDGDYNRTEPITVQICEDCHLQKETNKECSESPNGYHDYYTVFNYYATNEKSGTVSELMSVGTYTESELVDKKVSFEIKKRSAVKKCSYCGESKIFETNDFGDIKEKNIQSPFVGISEYETATTTSENLTTQPTTTQEETTTTTHVPETTTAKEPETTTTYIEPETTTPYVEPETEPITYPEPETEPEMETTVHVHNYSAYEALPATCTSSGVMIYSCSCGDSYSETIPQLQHNWVTSYSYDEEGNIVETIQCSICGSIR